MVRSVDDILDAAVSNALSRLRNEKPKQRVVKRTGNKKNLHQKGKNKVNLWTSKQS